MFVWTQMFHSHSFNLSLCILSHSLYLFNLIISFLFFSVFLSVPFSLFSFTIRNFHLCISTFISFSLCLFTLRILLYLPLFLHHISMSQTLKVSLTLSISIYHVFINFFSSLPCFFAHSNVFSLCCKCNENQILCFLKINSWKLIYIHINPKIGIKICKNWKTISQRKVKSLKDICCWFNEMFWLDR